MKISIKEMSLVGLFTALTAVGAFISLPLGPVPITLQTLFVLLGGLILGPKLASLSQVLYLLIGLAGIPVFSGFTGGLQTILKPSFGFIISFIIASFVVGKVSSLIEAHDSKTTITRCLIASSLGTIITYLIGLPYMYFIMNYVMNMGLSFYEVLKIGCLLFIPGDILKIIVSAIVGTKLLPIVKGLHQ